ncbi:hypothetical protein ACTQ1O_00705 [Bilifractor sp. LCP21S3_A7]|uniref:hypothetical protein n=1 Tax=Bilifractor sp. LCP21S3_A7 TaxID=3438738 RepID=UPI003F8EB4C8
MKLRETLRGMDRRQRITYLWDYYKWLFILLIIAGGILIYSLTTVLTRKKTVLSVALVNVQADDSILDSITDQFLQMEPEDFSGGTVKYERNLLISADPEDSTQDGSTGSVTDSGASYTASGTDGGASYEYSYASQMKLLAMITDKKLDVVIMDQHTRDIFQRQDYMSACVSLEGTSLYRKAGFSEPVYAGIIRNTQRPESAEKYLEILQQ